MSLDNEVPSGNTPLDLDELEKAHSCTIENCKCLASWDKTILTLISELRKARETIESYVGIMSRAELLASTREERLRSAEQALKHYKDFDINVRWEGGLVNKPKEVIWNSGLYNPARDHFAKYASDEGENNSKE